MRDARSCPPPNTPISLCHISNLVNSAQRILLISNSTVHGRGYLDHAEDEIMNFLAPASTVLFFPFALHDRDGYAAKAKERFA